MKRLRIVLFYSEVESFNYFTDLLAEELQNRGHEIFILDLLNLGADSVHSMACFVQFISEKVDVVICFDGLGIREDVYIELWDQHQAAVADILLDPPMRFHPVFEKHPQNYHLFCCDQDHIRYVKKYFDKTVSDITFMPHAGVLPSKNTTAISYKKRKYELLFTGTYYHYQDKLLELKQILSKDGDTRLYDFYLHMFYNLVENSSLTTDQAFHITLNQYKWTISENMLKVMLSFTEFVDWAIRMYQREQVVSTLIESGVNLYLLGRGWENHPLSNRLNVHIINKRIPFSQTLPYMADAKICLNVFPWFKSGTHERIFNALLQRSLPLTDHSHWVLENFTDRMDIALYDLNHLEQLPCIVKFLLANDDLVENIIHNGYQKVSKSFTWSNCVEQILKTLKI